MVSCGVATTESSDLKIMNGRLVKDDDIVAASTVALVYDGSKAFCTGTLIDRRFVLTASHCLDKMATGAVQVYFGVAAKPDMMDEKKLIKSESLLMHENYILESVELDRDTGYTEEAVNDIALLELAEEAPKEAVVVPMVKPGKKIKKDTAIILAGFGVTDPRSDALGELRRVETTYGGELKTKEVEIHRGEKNSCSGDSGGPLYVQQDGHLEVLGVLSRGDEFCVLTGIYTDVREFSDWIKTSMTKLSDEEPREVPPTMNVPFPPPHI